MFLVTRCWQTETQLQKQPVTGPTGLQNQINENVAGLQQKIQQQITGVQGQLEKKSTERQREMTNLISGMQKHLETQLTGFQGRIDGKVADLQQKIQKQITGVQGQLERKVTEQHKKTEKQISGMQPKLQDMLQTVLLQGGMLQTVLLQRGGMQALLQECKQIPPCLQSVTGFRPPLEIMLTTFSAHRSKGGRGTWKSDPFYSHPGGYKFQLSIDTNGYEEAQGTHITADLWPRRSKHEDKLSWPIKVTAHLQLLNQQGDYGHVVAGVNIKINKPEYRKEIARKYIAHSELEYNAAKDTQYLKDDCLHFRLYLKVTPH